MFFQVIFYEKHRGIRFFNNILIYDKEFIWLDHGFGSEEFKGNIYWNLNDVKEFMGFPSFRAWVNSSGHEMMENKIVGIYSNPMLYNINAPPPSRPKSINSVNLMPFTPTKNSPVINRGFRLDTLMQNSKLMVDLAGKPITTGGSVDLGTLEFQDN